MASLGFWPFTNAPGETVSRTMNGTAKTAMIVKLDGGDTTHVDYVVGCSSAGEKCDGIITTPQGDPNNSDQFVAGDVVDVTYSGTVPVLLAADTYAKGDIIIASGTTGVGKKLGGETGTLMVIGTFADLPQTTSTATALSVKLEMSLIKL